MLKVSLNETVIKFNFQGLKLMPGRSSSQSSSFCWESNIAWGQDSASDIQPSFWRETFGLVWDQDTCLVLNNYLNLDTDREYFPLDLTKNLTEIWYCKLEACDKGLISRWQNPGGAWSSAITVTHHMITKGEDGCFGDWTGGLPSEAPPISKSPNISLPRAASLNPTSSSINVAGCNGFPCSMAPQAQSGENISCSITQPPSGDSFNGELDIWALPLVLL